LTFVDAISQARDLVSEVHTLRSVPFDHLVRLVGHADQRGRTPITDVFFNYVDRSPISGMETADQIFSPEYVEFDHGLARFDLLCTVYRSDACFRLVLTVRCGDWTSIGPPPSADGFVDFLRRSFSEVGGVLPSASIGYQNGSRTESDAKHPEVQIVSDPTHDHLVWTIAGIYKDILGRRSFQPDDDFFASGGDSLKALRAFAAVRERFPTELTISTMFRDSTPHKLAIRLREESPAVSVEAFLQITEPGRPFRGYILPGVTGDILSMRRLVDGLGSEWSCRAAMYPGIGTPRAAFESLDEMLVYFGHAISQDYVPESSALIGYSFGGILGFELAVKLQQEQRAPALLVIIDAHLLKRYPVRFKPVPVGLHLRNLKAMDSEARKNYVLKRADAIRRRVRKLIRKPQGYDELPEVRRLTFANLRVVRDYQPSDRYTGQVLIVQGFRPDWMHTLEDDGANGWRRWLVKEPVVASVKASHINLIKSDAALDVASMIRKVFECTKAQAD
jgi:thioesterase domain-containing protein